LSGRACSCSDFTRTEAFRRAVAQAGTGLPAIEPGMPTPAGTGLTRRRFVERSLGLALAVYGADTISALAFDDGIAEAATLAPANNRVLVSVFLDGGADSLSLLFPAGDSLYYQLRPTLAIPASSGSAFSEDSRLRWHASCAAFAQLHAEGKLTVMPAIGYTSPDKSHFTSRHYWEVGATDAGLGTGWLGRYLDRVGSMDNPLQGLSLDNRLQPALASGRVPVAAIDGPDQYKFVARRQQEGPLENAMLQTVGALGAAHLKSKDPALRAAASAAKQSSDLRRQLLKLNAAAQVPPSYPQSNDGFPRRLAGLATMLAAGLPLRCVALQAPGMYDTHANQAAELDGAIKLTGDSLLAFQRDLEARGLADRVLIHVWSEFGRRARENGSDGTDHGAAGLGLLIGTRVRGQMIGEFPGLAGGLDPQGNLRATADFRGVYGAILEQWFDADAAAVIPNAASFARPALIR
jgi:uncharacterized protein (DUF1501 family)